MYFKISETSADIFSHHGFKPEKIEPGRLLKIISGDIPTYTEFGKVVADQLKRESAFGREIDQNDFNSRVTELYKDIAALAHKKKTPTKVIENDLVESKNLVESLEKAIEDNKALKNKLVSALTSRTPSGLVEVSEFLSAEKGKHKAAPRVKVKFEKGEALEKYVKKQEKGAPVVYPFPHELPTSTELESVDIDEGLDELVTELEAASKGGPDVAAKSRVRVLEKISAFLSDSLQKLAADLSKAKESVKMLENRTRKLGEPYESKPSGKTLPAIKNPFADSDTFERAIYKPQEEWSKPEFVPTTRPGGEPSMVHDKGIYKWLSDPAVLPSLLKTLWVKRPSSGEAHWTEKKGDVTMTGPAPLVEKHPLKGKTDFHRVMPELNTLIGSIQKLDHSIAEEIADIKDLVQMEEAAAKEEAKDGISTSHPGHLLPNIKKDYWEGLRNTRKTLHGNLSPEHFRDLTTYDSSVGVNGLEHGFVVPEDKLHDAAPWKDGGTFNLKEYRKSIEDMHHKVDGVKQSAFEKSKSHWAPIQSRLIKLIETLSEIRSSYKKLSGETWFHDEMVKGLEKKVSYIIAAEKKVSYLDPEAGLEKIMGAIKGVHGLAWGELSTDHKGKMVGTTKKWEYKDPNGQTITKDHPDVGTVERRTIKHWGTEEAIRKGLMDKTLLVWLDEMDKSLHAINNAIKEYQDDIHAFLDGIKTGVSLKDPKKEGPLPVFKSESKQTGNRTLPSSWDAPEDYIKSLGEENVVPLWKRFKNLDLKEFKSPAWDAVKAEFPKWTVENFAAFKRLLSKKFQEEFHKTASHRGGELVEIWRGFRKFAMFARMCASEDFLDRFAAGQSDPPPPRSTSMDPDADEKARKVFNKKIEFLKMHHLDKDEDALRHWKDAVNQDWSKVQDKYPDNWDANTYRKLQDMVSEHVGYTGEAGDKKDPGSKKNTPRTMSPGSAPKMEPMTHMTTLSGPYKPGEMVRGPGGVSQPAVSEEHRSEYPAPSSGKGFGIPMGHFGLSGAYYDNFIKSFPIDKMLIDWVQLSGGKTLDPEKLPALIDKEKPKLLAEVKKHNSEDNVQAKIDALMDETEAIRTQRKADEAALANARKIAVETAEHMDRVINMKGALQEGSAQAIEKIKSDKDALKTESGEVYNRMMSSLKTVDAKGVDKAADDYLENFNRRMELVDRIHGAVGDNSEAKRAVDTLREEINKIREDWARVGMKILNRMHDSFEKQQKIDKKIVRLEYEKEHGSDLEEANAVGTFIRYFWWVLEQHWEGRGIKKMQEFQEVFNSGFDMNYIPIHAKLTEMYKDLYPAGTKVQTLPMSVKNRHRKEGVKPDGTLRLLPGDPANKRTKGAPAGKGDKAPARDSPEFSGKSATELPMGLRIAREFVTGVSESSAVPYDLDLILR